ncbi:uncharacterized protein LOC127130689 [Lathyrus oleraceus]|uniref:uncharacterized protein LOC127130689 n=1 Tax=Pisum sativum TaxID=3888 RepID=UPI0021D14393|nr:uncharacterized protein LOC127130689 [Pisum sativum]
MSIKLLVFDGKKWNRWMIQMCVLFYSQDILDLIKYGYISVALLENTMDAQRNAKRDMRKKCQKKLFYIHKCMDANVFEKIDDSTTAKAAWEIPVRCYGGDVSVKKVKLRSLHKQYENLNMKNKEKIPDNISRVILITNEIKSCRENISEEKIIEKVLRSLTPQFDYIVVEIEHSKKLRTMIIKEIHSCLKAQELRMTERNSEIKAEECSKGKDKYDKRKVQCCKRFGHFATDCWSNKEKKSKEENIDRGDSDDESVLLMAYESNDSYYPDWWYMDIGFSNHLNGNKKWMVDFDSRKRTQIKCANDKYLNTKDAKRRKLDDRRKVMFLVEYHNTGAYELYCPVTNKVDISRDVIVKESESWDWSESQFNSGELTSEDTSKYEGSEDDSESEGDSEGESSSEGDSAFEDD